MEEKGNIIFNISGGTQQILPNATKAEQNFYFNSDGREYMPEATPKPQDAEDSEPDGATAGDGDSATESTDEAEDRLALYIDKVRVKEYAARLRSCVSAREVGMTVAMMVADTKLYEEMAKKERFLTTLLPFLSNVQAGLTFGNLRKQIKIALNEQAMRKK